MQILTKKKAGVVIILSKKCVSQNILKYITGNKDNYFIQIKGKVYQKIEPFKSVPNNTASK